MAPRGRQAQKGVLTLRAHLSGVHTMRIAVCGAQMPFARGGAELLMDNLVAAFRAAGHDTELVRLPVAWERPRLFDSALAWRLIPTDSFDVVIPTNFPSYFVRHPNKVVWLLHQ